MAPTSYTALVQSKELSTKSRLPLAIAPSCSLPDLPSPYHVLVRVCAVALNPSDWKMPTFFYAEGNGLGVDFCGIIEEAGPLSTYSPQVRVCGAANFPYAPNGPRRGAFAQYTVADSRCLLKVPDGVTDSQAAAIGGVGWGTSCLAISDSEALGLAALPSKPADKPIPVLVYGGATATGIMAIQILKLSGYLPISVCSPKSSELVRRYGAVGTASYLSSTVADIKKLAGGVPIKHVLDCITTPESVSHCFEAISRVGGRYACLEAIPNGCTLRRAVKVKVVMGYEWESFDVEMNHPVYSRKANPASEALRTTWVKEIQSLLDKREITTKPIREINGGFEGIIKGLNMIYRGEEGDKKLVVGLSS
ncbi:zinc-binding dehydrogenase [Hirsutella rhossiliensis]|uniref:Zinc-binding dehydrogenase domain-containing protein n=1 Tax=Hirsutella rhossiliensis TaxID=111463 RepID=A0A9P8N2M2_9HYPO|nr:zinc-binding dehydrogenase domain-containing protein [Hirsutella rhossiliensis]KAH0964811.1 zinc-binding dehydrogenase domain-containing protein [Hirsutella rhossiliensis]